MNKAVDCTLKRCFCLQYDWNGAKRTNLNILTSKQICTILLHHACNVNYQGYYCTLDYLSLHLSYTCLCDLNIIQKISLTFEHRTQTKSLTEKHHWHLSRTEVWSLETPLVSTYEYAHIWHLSCENKAHRTSKVSSAWSDMRATAMWTLWSVKISCQEACGRQEQQASWHCINQHCQQTPSRDRCWNKTISTIHINKTEAD